MSNRIAVVDTHRSGHHLEYVYGVCYGMAGKSQNLDVYCHKDFYNYQSKNNLEDVSRASNIKLLTNKLKEPEGGWLKKTTIAYKNIKVISSYDEVIFLSINVYFVALLLFKLTSWRSFKIKGIYFNPFLRNIESRKNAVKRVTLKLLIKLYAYLKIFVLNDINVVRKLNHLFNTQAFQVIQDPIPTFYYKQFKDTGSGNKNYLTYTLIGSISERKGVFEFLKAIEASKSNNHFQIIGSVEDSIANKLTHQVSLLKRKGFAVSLVDKFLSNAEFASFIFESDVILLPYLTTGASSGILGHAAFAGKHVIGPEKGLLKKLIGKYKLGVSINPKDYKKFADLLNKENLDWINGEILRKQYVQKHSQEKFINTLFEEY